ncbi:hypothetical protein [Fredinandcohnia quinoae]|uniref:Uncharacterized protein n=1 Tax=Fredinandcohnia quinoae TaxID=2918902 RepID=A0AAW5DZ11_9BACI|nr:hypothetical protein [Fredinandcohnia sp. SECRCQ15]MCH1624554.1 hypothetical protein [Fredinandcohnia sp. SECRCQ15]
MKVYVSVKQAGKRRAFLTKEELELKNQPTSLRALITEVISMKVEEYNDKALDSPLVQYLSFDEIETEIQTGKVGFGYRTNEQKADVEKAIETAILAYTDGLYRVFVEDKEIEKLDEPLTIQEGDILTFIRFTMLSGRMW